MSNGLMLAFTAWINGYVGKNTENQMATTRQDFGRAVCH